MAARIPHTFRRPSGTYYARLYWPDTVRRLLPGLPAELRFSLHTRIANEARRIIYEAMSDFSQLIVLIEKNTHKISDGTDKELVSDLTTRLRDVRKWRTVMLDLSAATAATHSLLAVTPASPLGYPGVSDHPWATPHSLRAQTTSTIDNKLVIDLFPDGRQQISSDLTDKEAAQQEVLAFLRRLSNHSAEQPNAKTVEAVMRAFTHR